jgi:hypothetical protein
MTRVPEYPKTIGARETTSHAAADIGFGRTAPSDLATATYMQSAVLGHIEVFCNDLKLLVEFKWQ